MTMIDQIIELALAAGDGGWAVGGRRGDGDARQALRYAVARLAVDFQDGGETSVGNCVPLCQFHHDVCIRRWGWELTLHPDGTTTAYGPRGQILHSHAPATARPG